jgi:small-conductance mechanosensitive channel
MIYLFYWGIEKLMGFVDWKDYIISVLITLVVVYGFMWLFLRLLHFVFLKFPFLTVKKKETIESVLRTSLNFISFIILLLAILKPFVDLTSLLAGAGVLGVVLGFGAQSLIKDILTGFFFLFENQFQKGDVVTINQKYTGTVEEVGFRALKIREWGGKLLTISNGEIKEILNGNVNRRRVLESLTVSYREDPEKIMSVLNGVCDRLNADFPIYFILDVEGIPEEPFKVRGITNLNSMFHGIEYTVMGLVDDINYFDVMYKTREYIAKALYDNDIKMAETKVYVENEK